MSKDEWDYEETKRQGTKRMRDIGLSTDREDGKGNEIVERRRRRWGVG